MNIVSSHTVLKHDGRHWRTQRGIMKAKAEKKVVRDQVQCAHIFPNGLQCSYWGTTGMRLHMLRAHEGRKWNRKQSIPLESFINKRDAVLR